MSREGTKQELSLEQQLTHSIIQRNWLCVCLIKITLDYRCHCN